MRTFGLHQKQHHLFQHRSKRQTRNSFAHNAPRHVIPHLQHTIGNQAVQRLLQTNEAPPQIQLKRTVSTPGDRSEQEADRAADQVMRAESPPEPFQTAPVREDHTGETTAPSSIREAISSPGRPLDAATRGWMASRFGEDFAHVRVHTDDRAAVSARTLGARAYTVGSDLVFEADEYAPATAEGKRLLAHELAHVVQQRASGDHRIQRQPKPSQKVPPGPGELTVQEYEAWAKKHPKREVRAGGDYEAAVIFARYKPQWFWDRGYIYAGYGGNFPYYWWEVWISDEGNGKEFRVWHTTDWSGTQKGTPPKPPPAPKKAPPEPHTVVVEGTENWPTEIPLDVDLEDLFGFDIAEREGNTPFGKGLMVRYQNGAVAIFPEGTTERYIVRPLPPPNLGYLMYDKDGKLVSDVVMSYPEDTFPDPKKDAIK
ncbi:MAG: DUF4157 domain-containing protein [Candidatus Manganitrophus sp. SA1]|nr:DUF4157 domain-containing protein [Candidatus Manganitrophus morganii]